MDVFEIDDYSEFVADFYFEEAEQRLIRRASKTKKLKRRSSIIDLSSMRVHGRRQFRFNRRLANSRNSKSRGRNHYGFTKLRNAERLSKELNTTIHLLNLTVQVEIPSANEDCLDSDHKHTPSESRVDEELLEDQENTLKAIEDLHFTENHVEDNETEVSPQIQKSIDSSEIITHQLKLLGLSDPLKDTTWSFEFMEDIQITLKGAIQRKCEIMDELQDQNCCLNSSGCEIGSMSSIGSLATQADENCRRLGLTFQSLFNVSLDTTLSAFQLLRKCFASSKNPLLCNFECSLPQSIDLLRIYRKLGEMESAMSTRGIGPVRLIKDQTQLQRKLQTIQNFTKAVHGFVIKIQNQVLSDQYMIPEVSKSVEKRVKNPLVLLKQLWDWLRDVNNRVIQLHPELKKEVYILHLNTILETTKCATIMQTTPEITRIINLATSVEKFEPDGIPEEVILSQEWLLPCIINLQSHAKDLLKQIKHNPKLKAKAHGHLISLKNEFSKLILVTISRMWSSTLFEEGLPQAKMEKRRFYGMETTRLIQKYLSSPLVNPHVEMEAFEVINKIMNNLITSICTFNSKLQLQRGLAALVPEHPLSGLSLTLSGATGTSIRAPIDQPPPRVLSSDSSVDFSSPFLTQEEAPEESVVLEALSNGVHEIASVEAGSLDQPLGWIPPLGHFHQVDCKVLEMVNPLGSGSSANVYLMKYFGAPVAVKVAKFENEENKAMLRMEKEAEIHQRVNNHPRIVRYLGKYMDCNQQPHKTLGIIMEYCELGNLTSAIREAQWLMKLDQDEVDIKHQRGYLGFHLYKDWKKRLSLACNIAAGMSFLHHLKIVHRDLTSYNVVLHRIGHGEVFGAKLCDFERSNYVPEGGSLPRSGTIANSPPWSAPEVLNHREYTTQADVFSMGVVLWELMYLENPWDRLRTQMQRSEVEISCFLSNGSRLPLSPQHAPEGLPEFPQLVELVKSAWRDDPQKRPTMVQFHDALERIKGSIESRLQ